MQSVIIFALLIIPLYCFPWGADGHKIAVYIAESYLTPEVREQIKNLLGDDSLTSVATWADEVKKEPAYKDTRTMHYVNVKQGMEKFDLERDCSDNKCVVSAILKYKEVLLNKDASKKDKVDALKFLIHFVGDIHQPLHVGLAKDYGGNDIRVEFMQNFTNLHRLWDSGLIRQTHKKWQEYAEELKKSISQEKINEWKKDIDPIKWANESYKLALSNAYAIPKNGQLGEEYYNQNIKVVDIQLSKAGIRLAEMLNQIFSKEKVEQKDKNAEEIKNLEKSSPSLSLLRL